MSADTSMPSRLRVWIDATRPQSGLDVFGLSLLERHLRALLHAKIPLEEVRIEVSGDVPILPADLAKRLPLRWSPEAGAPRARLERALREAAGARTLALDADSILDTRLFEHCARSDVPCALVSEDPDCGGPAAVLLLTGPLGAAIQGERVLDLARAALRSGAVKSLAAESAGGYVKRLRRTLVPYAFAVRSAPEADAARRYLFWSNYKGSTDFFTRYVYPFFVWRALGPLTRWRVHPNVVTVLNVVITLAAVPLWAHRWWVSGFLCAWGMSVLDSVDGKLARLTYRSSEIGHNLDHGLDLIHPPFWYFAWAWALSNGDPSSWLFRSSIAMAVVYFLDRILVRVFTRRTNRSIHAYAPIDVRMRTIISRRNINLPLFTVGLPLGLGVETFAFIVLWQYASFAFHLLRVIQCWNAGRAEDAGAGDDE